MTGAVTRVRPASEITKRGPRAVDTDPVKGLDPAVRALARLEESKSVLKAKLGERVSGSALIAPALTIAAGLQRGTISHAQLCGTIGQELAALAGGDLGGKLGAVAGFLLAPLSLPVVIAGSVLGAYFGRRGGRALARRLSK